MRRDTVVADSTVWIDLLNDRDTPQVGWVERNLAKKNIRLLDLTLCEVLQGVRNNLAFSRAEDMLHFFGVVPTGGILLATRSASNYRFLRSKGITVRKTIDCIIATYCIEQSFWLLHNDRDFEPFETHLGLKVIHPGG